MSKPYLLVETNLGNFKWYLPTIETSSIDFSRYDEFSYSEYCDEAYRLFSLNIRAGDVFRSHSADKAPNETLLNYFNILNHPSIRPGGGYWKIGDAVGTWTLYSTSPEMEYYQCTLRYNNTIIATIHYSYYTTTDYDRQARVQFPFIYDKTTGKIIVVNEGDNFTIIESTVSLPYRFYLASEHSITSVQSLALDAAIGGTVPVDPDGDDPYDPGGGGSGYSGPGGGQGGHDDTSDDIDNPALPTDYVTGNGIFSAYNPSTSQLTNFANKLWNRDPTTVDDWFRLLFGGDAFNGIIGLHLLPVQPSTSSTQTIYLGNWDTGASAPKISNQYKQVDFGSVTLDEYWGNCIDYSPYTRIQLALPYIGIVDVDTDDVMKAVNTLVYNIDVYSGALTATLKCTKGELDSVMYEWSGNCATNLPITGANYNAIIGIAIGLGGASAGIATAVGSAINPAVGLGVGMLAAGAGSAISTYGSGKGKIQRSGNFNGATGALGIMTPYFIISRPVQSVPSTWQADKGYPANISARLGDLTGYTEISEINLQGVYATQEELEEIITLLKTGVIF